MTDRLRLTIRPEDDGSVELFADVDAAGFGGRASAWFDRKALIAFAMRLIAEFPLRNPLELRGGFWSTTGEVVDEHLAIRFYPIDQLGVVGCQVRLATALQAPCRPEEQFALRVELQTRHEGLHRFATSFIALTAGDVDEAVLVADVG
jgi:hypothetical protein